MKPRRTCRRHPCISTRDQLAAARRDYTSACNALGAEKKRVVCLTLAIEALPTEQRDACYEMARALDKSAGIVTVEQGLVVEPER